MPLSLSDIVVSIWMTEAYVLLCIGFSIVISGGVLSIFIVAVDFVSSVFPA